VERIVLPTALVCKVSAQVLSQVTVPGGIALLENQPIKHVPGYEGLAGWHQLSGLPLPAERGRLLAWAEEEFKSADAASARRLSVNADSKVQERAETRAIGDRRLTACIFGLGNYVKTCILPNIDPRIRVAGIHEIDPTQVGRTRRRECVYDTCGQARPDEKYDVYFVAGYHHTHADLAVHALKQGAWVVVEKPLVTTSEQLDRLLKAMRDHPGRLFTGFHKRFSPLLNLARSDMVHRPGMPINYSCIVYEVPLPRRHWYNWPNSCSRLVSNGCHWLDQFLFLNDFCPYTRYSVWRGGNGDAHVSVELENGATFGMILTDAGSRRIGVQDHIELRSSGVTVKIDNDSRYVAEDDSRILRRASINKFDLYKYTYGGHCRRIFAGSGGASVESVERTCRLVLDLEELWQEQRLDEKP
jgi:predicted dehydrogenase